MSRKLNHKTKVLFVPVAALVIILIIVGVARLNKQERSVASYCKTLAEEKASLGDKSLPAHAQEFAEMYQKLEKVAPDEIQNNVHTLKVISEKMAADPSQALGASISGISTERELKNWEDQHCKSN